MSEKLPTSNEVQSENHVNNGSKDHHERLKAKLENEANEASKNASFEQVEQAQKKIEQIARSNEQLKHTHDAQPHKHHERGTLSRAYDQKISFTRTMTRVRKRLNPIERPISKVIHNPLVDKTSEVVGQTVARPSAMLGGALFAFLGTSALLWITKHYGYEFNYLVVMLLFLGGLVIGIVVEALLKVKKSRAK